MYHEYALQSKFFAILGGCSPPIEYIRRRNRRFRSPLTGWWTMDEPHMRKEGGGGCGVAGKHVVGANAAASEASAAAARR